MINPRGIPGHLDVLTPSSETTMHVNFPPGLTFIFRNLPIICLPIGGTYILHKFIQTHVDIKLPIWALILPLVLSLPVALSFKVLYSEYANKRDAATCGAILAPQVYDRWPAGIGLLMKSVRNHKEGYPGRLDCFSTLYNVES